MDLNCINNDFKSRFESGEAAIIYHGIFRFPFCYLKNVKIKIYALIDMPAILYICEARYITFSGEHKTDGI
jgi:hypothetical protein